MTARSKDQFYTKPDTVKMCFAMFDEVMATLQIDTDNYNFIEPSAGCGCFYNLLPENRRVGIDIDPAIDNIITADYLQWRPDTTDNIVIGNPPFGVRGDTALKFINHSYTFADVVAFILPQLFESDGKGSTMKRVYGYSLAYSEKLPINSFHYPNGKDVDIGTVFQVWTKVNIHKIQRKDKKICNTFIEVYSLSDGGTPGTTRNKNMIGKCDVYLPSTTYKDMKAVNSFEELPHRRGYGIVIFKNKEEIKRLFYSHDWNSTAFRSTNSALNLRTSLIHSVVAQAGFYEKPLTLFDW